MLDVLEDGLIDRSQAEDFLDRLLSVSRTMAIEAIEAAEARGGRWGHLVQALQIRLDGRPALESRLVREGGCQLRIGHFQG
jgi:hypothetical protein